MKYFAIDYGDTRTGMAVSDLGGTLSFAIGCVTAKDAQTAAEKVAEKIKESGAETIIVGLPKNMDGSEGFRAQKTRKFSEILSSLLPDIPLLHYDERLTTCAATYYLNKGNVRGKDRKKVIDALSAEIILQNYLDSLKK